MYVQVSGIVRESNLIRARLQEGLSADELENFKQKVRSTVRHVEELCREQGVKPASLPLPTRNAYKFLKELNLDRLPIVDQRSATKVKQLRLSNIKRSADQFNRLFWTKLDLLSNSTAFRVERRKEILEVISGVEKYCKDSGSSPAHLEPASMQAFSWLKFVSDSDNYEEHLRSLCLARKILTAKRLNGEVELTNMRSLWRYNKREDGVYLFKIHEGFIQAPEEVWNALLTLRTGDCQAANTLVREFAHGEQFAEIAYALETMVDSAIPKAKGRVHDLEESFDRVNKSYFNGAVKKPILTWNRIVTSRKFGHYDRMRDTVMLSISLDDESVPAFVVDSVMHHELLHKVHGTMFVNGRRISHSAEFRRQEKLFARYEQAEEVLGMLARKNRK